MKKLTCLIFLITITSCTSLEMIRDGIIGNFNHESANVYIDDDYLDHLVSLGEDYLSSPGVDSVKLSKRSRSYLESIYNRLIRNSELIFDKREKPTFTILKNRQPFYFSLPRSRFFISSGLLLKYLKNEQLLVAAIAHEIIKSQKNLYEKRVLVPVGFLTTEKILSMTRIPLSIKSEVNKWTYYMLRRAGYDSSAYLNWLQTQNKNTLDFTLQYGDTRTLSREEFLYKNFLVTQGLSDKEESFLINSSSYFYKLIREVKRGSSEIRTI
ncbi:MAG: hypothetical protein KC493_09970 [Bacteriovoracaceae bacterium]|nr:hypothetical protein [Bacteriovoracaceae bacterium]